MEPSTSRVSSSATDPNKGRFFCLLQSQAGLSILDKVQTIFNTIFLAITAFALFLDSFFHPKAADTYLLLDSKVYLLLFVSWMLLYKTTHQTVLPSIITKINRFLFPILVVICFAFILMENLIFETYVLNNFHFHYEEFLFITILSGFISYLQIKPVDIFQSTAYHLGPVVFLFFVYMYFFELPLFLKVVREDGPIEMFQFSFYFLSATISLYNFIKHFKKHRLISLYYLVFFVVLIFISLEELAWGQRLFGLTTPESLAQINNQKEITLHNIKPVENSIHLAYIVIGLWGIIGHKLFNNWIAPSKYLVFYFFVIFAYFIAHRYAHLYYDIYTSARVSVPRWQELSELCLSMGVFFFMLEKVGNTPPRGIFSWQK